MAESANRGLRPAKVEELAEWAVSRRAAAIGDAGYLKVLVLDTLACAIAALAGEAIGFVRGLSDELGGAPLCARIGGGRTAPDRAAFFNGALVRYLDFMDIVMVEGQTFHPSDNLGAVLAAADYAGASGADFLVALAVAYEVQTAFSEESPLQEQGFDHVTHLAYSMPAGIARALGLPVDQAANAIALCGSFLNTLWIVRTGRLSRWKGFASAQAAMSAMHMTLLAARGMTGPLDVLEGERAWESAVGKPVNVTWSERPLTAFRQSSVKRFNAEAHTQSILEGLLELKAKHGVDARDVRRVEVECFKQALNIVGGGAGGDRWVVLSKEQADHSIPYLCAVALLDGDVWPEQFATGRVVRDDVQELLGRVWVRQREELTHGYPAEMPVRVRLLLGDGRELEVEKRDYRGFWRTRPLDWDGVGEKYERLTRLMTDAGLRDEIANAVRALDQIPIRDLTSLLERVALQAPSGRAG